MFVNSYFFKNAQSGPNWKSEWWLSLEQPPNYDGISFQDYDVSESPTYGDTYSSTVYRRLVIRDADGNLIESIPDTETSFPLTEWFSAELDFIPPNLNPIDPITGEWEILFLSYGVLYLYGADNTRISFTYNNNSVTYYSQFFSSQGFYVDQPTPDIVITGQSPFTAEFTSNATLNTSDFTVYLEEGQTLNFGSTNIAGGQTDHDTYIRLLDPSGAEVADNDDHDSVDYDSNNNGLGSFISYVARSTGTYVMRVGCYADGFCSGSIGWNVGWNFPADVPEQEV